jgi:PAS domain S-box-containing protein
MSKTTIDILLLSNLLLLVIALVVLHFYSRRMKGELKHNDELLKQAQHYRDLFDTTEVGLVHTDLKGRLVLLNRAAAKNIGFEKPEDLYGENINVVQFYADPSEADWIREQLESGKRIHNRVLKLINRKGHLTYFMISAHSRFDANGKPVGFESISYNVTDRVMLEEELANYSDNLETMVRKKTDEILMLEKKKFDLDKLAAVGETMASLVRLLNVPFSVLRNSFYVMKAQGLYDETEGRMMELLEKEGIRFNQLLEDSLHFATPEKLHAVTRNVHPILDQAAGKFEEEFKKRRIAFRMEYAPGIPRVSVDSDRLIQVIVNLLQNAMEAMRDGDRGIVLKTEYAPGKASLRISVEDNGAGISEEDMKKLFDPFFTRKPEGTGLGLPVVRKIMEAHRGTVSIESRLGEGTRVRVELPVDPRPSLHDPV